MEIVGQSAQELHLQPRLLLAQESRWTLKHQYWEANKVADLPAKRATHLDKKCRILQQPTEEVFELLEQDRRGTSWARTFFV
ncbi:hypothetical protein M9H77_20692 [Catharanthus roseus]|uniref:Uncharacterized protein n=1 Tax=Catharanthus roseus TaxID=4058 RepID=A0ACC0ALC3_CATRO|nr:hypothetical protein M9H77_20692 [Catharanthus roseus]